jgi:hypothetical protein
VRIKKEQEKSYRTSDFAVGVGVSLASSEDISIGSPLITNVWVATVALELGGGLFSPLDQNTCYVCGLVHRTREPAMRDLPRP